MDVGIATALIASGTALVCSLVAVWDARRGRQAEARTAFLVSTLERLEGVQKRFIAAGRDSDDEDIHTGIANVLVAKRAVANKFLQSQSHLLPDVDYRAIAALRDRLSLSQAYLAGTQAGLTYTGSLDEVITDPEEFVDATTHYIKQVEVAISKRLREIANELARR